MSSVFDQITGTDKQNDVAEQDDNNSTPVNNESSAEHDAPSSAVQYTPQQLKSASQELLKYGLLEMANKPKLYQTALNHTQAINDILEPFDLLLRIDDVRGLAYLVVSESMSDNDNMDDDEWSHPLIRRQRLNLEQSLLLAILREFYVAHELEVGIGGSNAVVSLDDLSPRLQIYLGEMGSEMAEQKRLRNLLDKLKTHGIVSDIDKYDQVTIRPIITHVANPENLDRLLHRLKQHSSS